MNYQEIKKLRKKIETDPILTDEEIEYIRMAREEALLMHLLELKRLQAELAVKDMAIADLRAENEELNEYIGAQARK